MFQSPEMLRRLSKRRGNRGSTLPVLRGLIAPRRILRDRFASPIDGGARSVDGRPLFGSSQTWRGISFSVRVTSVCAPLVGPSWRIGALVASVAMAGVFVFKLPQSSHESPRRRQGDWPRPGSGVSVPTTRLSRYSAVDGPGCCRDSADLSCR